MIAQYDWSQCTEPDGNDLIEVKPTISVTAHVICLNEMGYCPWCGKQDTYNQER